MDLAMDTVVVGVVACILLTISQGNVIEIGHVLFEISAKLPETFR